MRVLAYIAVALSLGSIAMSIWIVLTSPIAMEHVRARQFPLGPFGEATLGMIFPILLSTLAFVVGVWTIRRRSGRVAMVLIASSWLVVYGVLGARGFQSLF